MIEGEWTGEDEGEDFGASAVWFRWLRCSSDARLWPSALVIDARQIALWLSLVAF